MMPDQIAQRLLDALADGVPLELRPFAGLDGVGEADAIAALRALRDSRDVRRVGARFSPAGLGYVAALGALAVPEDRSDDVAAQLDGLPNVTHVFEIEDRYRLWYVIAAPSRARLEIAESELARAAGASDRYRVLSDELFKVTAEFDADGVPEASDAVTAADSPVLDRDEKALVRLLQGDLPLEERPYAALARTLGECGFDVDERWVLDRTRALADVGALRGVAITRRTRVEPWRTALVVWRCPEDPEAAGRLVASFPEVLHVFERRVPGGMAVFSVIEGENRPGIDRAIERIRLAGALDAPRIAFPLREYARSPLRYFTEGD